MSWSLDVKDVDPKNEKMLKDAFTKLTNTKKTFNKKDFVDKYTNYSNQKENSSFKLLS